MEVRYIAVYKLHGANTLSEGTESVDLLALPNPVLTATLTTNLEPYLLHVDKSAALRAQLLKGLFAPDKAGTLQERLAAEIEDVKARRASQTGTGVFLIMDGKRRFRHRSSRRARIPMSSRFALMQSQSPR